jgi:phosphatidylserine decarboxylase
MRIPITKYGLPQVAVFPAVILILMVVIFFWFKNQTPIGWMIATEVILLIVLIWVLAFFRDPARQIPTGDDFLLSPADGVIADIEIVEDHPEIGEKVLRIGIFLNIFNVHINRVPCAVRIDSTTYNKGKFVNAMSPDCGRVNESNDIVMTRLAEPADKLLVRQISGAIARRIVCQAEKGDEFVSGQQFGMIKFGSRTELYLPIREEAKCQVKVGDKVKAGLTILVRYE